MQRFLVLSFLLATFMTIGCGGPIQQTPPVLGFDGALANKYVHAGSAGMVTARLVITARAPKDAVRPPVTLALVIDTSGSMEGKPIADARAASLSLIESLTKRDRLAVVVFNSRAEVLVPMTNVGDLDKKRLAQTITDMKAEGTTDLAHGLEAGLAEVVRDFDPKALNHIVLLGDGVPNDEATIRDQAATAGARGVSITTLGLGPDYNETLMGQVAQASGGRFHYVDDSSKIAQFFGDEVNRLQSAEARNASLQITPGPGVVIQNVVGQAWSPEGHGARVALGDLGHGDSREIVVTLATSEHRSGAAVEVMDAVLHYADAKKEGPEIEQRLFLGARAVASESELTSGKNDEVVRAVARVQAAADTLLAIERARAGDVAGAHQAIDSVNQNAPPKDEATRRARKELDQALPTLAPAQAQPSPKGAAPASSPPPPAVVRSMHDAAMKTLQSL